MLASLTYLSRPAITAIGIEKLPMAIRIATDGRALLQLGV